MEVWTIDLNVYYDVKNDFLAYALPEIRDIPVFHISDSLTFFRGAGPFFADSVYKNNIS